ncbi:MAG: EAL domain-containing protein, partial [Methylococcaceae bacterium]|nr:EAL domain-containing protein [Methylococcaceae bacterium]
VSAKQFRQADFITQIEQVLDKNNLLASHLFIELTEGVVVENLTDTIEKMQLLKKMGVRISIDDFGTGYSSLSYLKQLPIDQLKIDQSFVRDITTDSNNAIIVETIIKMAHDLHLDVIAEGVETLQQKNFLISKGCSVFQGSYFCGPLSASQFKAFVS